MKRVVSVSLGSSKGDKVHETEILGVPFRIERRGTDGDLRRFAEQFRELDGRVDALGVGGADIWVVVGRRRYAFRQIREIVRSVRQTPVVDGSGLKHTLERETVHRLQRDGTVDFRKERALLVSAVDRYGMAEALHRLCPHVVFGDVLFGLGLPVPIRSYRTLTLLGATLLPIVTRLPFQWFYPTGEKQEKRTPKFARYWNEATFLCGDTHLVRRFCPDRLPGKTVLTQTVRKATVEWFAGAGVSRLITTTPIMGGETFATNVMEAVIVALLEKPADQISTDEMLDVLARLGWAPGIVDLNG
ncbi:MAG: quinate 5-dehydrogenase [Fimbriimonadaceae bacterium]